MQRQVTFDHPSRVTIVVVRTYADGSVLETTTEIMPDTGAMMPTYELGALENVTVSTDSESTPLVREESPRRSTDRMAATTTSPSTMDSHRLRTTSHTTNASPLKRRFEAVDDDATDLVIGLEASDFDHVEDVLNDGKRAKVTTTSNAVCDDDFAGEDGDDALSETVTETE